MTLIKEKYKKTEFGIIPDDWEVVDFGRLFEFKNGINASKEMYGSGVKFINVMEVIYNDFITSDKIPGSIQLSEKQFEMYSVKKGDVLFNRTSETTEEVGLASVYLDDEDVVFGGFVIRARARENLIDDEFKKYCFRPKYIRDQIIKSGQGAVRSNIGQGDLEKIQLLLPPFIEQKKIAKVLSSFDKAIENTTRAIIAEEKLKTGIGQNLLGGKNRFQEFQNEKWEEISLSEVAEFENGKAHENCIVESGKYIVVNSKFISTEGKVRKFTNKNLSPLYKGDIVMVMSDVPNGKAIGKCFVIDMDERYTLNQRICRIKSLKGDAKFLYYVLNRNPYFLEFDSGVGQTNLRKDEVLGCPVPFISKQEQQKISSFLEIADLKIRTLKVQLDQLKEGRKGLMHLLLTGKKRVKI